MRDKFEECFKPAEDEHALLAQLTQMNKDTHEGMGEFIAKFNKLANIIPINSKPTPENLKCFFINTQLPEVSFFLRQAFPANLVVAQSMATEIEDDLIRAGKIKRILIGLLEVLIWRVHLQVLLIQWCKNWEMNFLL